MRSGQLHQSLHAFATEAGQALTAATSAGAEVGFEVVEERARTHRPALYCYRPLTAVFIARNWQSLRALPSAASAIAGLAGLPGLGSYLEAHPTLAAEGPGACAPGELGDLAEAALRCFASRVFDGAEKTFVLVPERFEPAYRELYENAIEQRNEIAVLGLLRGVSTVAKEIALGDGVLLAPLARLGRVPPDPIWMREERPSLVVAIDPGEETDGVERALTRMLELQTAMRLYAGGISFAPLAWIHAEGSEWRALPLPAGGRSDGKVALVAEQQEELCTFCATVARRRPGEGPLAWALRRFELGCSRADRLEGLSDHLLALRALLEPEGPGSGRLAGRLAALCAGGPDRSELTKRILRAISLEQAVISGGVLGGTALALAAEVEERLRSVLREAIAGELRGDLAAAADARIYMPEADAGVEHGGDFHVTRASTGTFAADLFATPQPPSRAPDGALEPSVFETPTTELLTPTHD
jgi:hypothetical protein